MLIPALILVPFLAGLLAMLIRSHPMRRALLVAAACLHLVLTVLACMAPEQLGPNDWLGLDGPGRLFLAVTSVIFLAAALYAHGYLSRETPEEREDLVEGLLFSNAPEAIFTGCMLGFLATMTLVTVSQHLGFLWIAIEATTLASAPLIYFHRHRRSLEATWKYLLICSVGIALALLGNFFLVVAASAGPADNPLLLRSLLDSARELSPMWLRLGFVLLLVGYGTKMGLAPFHTWLPDTHGESPSVVSALLSGALLNCAFLGIMRGYQVCLAAGQFLFAQQLMIVLGLASMLVAAIFIVTQRDFKRMLAYSSIEHMGILALGMGVGGVAGFGAMFHAVNHSLTKAMMFLVSGNVMEAYQTRAIVEVRGVVRLLPVSGCVWLAGFFALTGTPPFAPFISEFVILRGALERSGLVAVLYVVLLALIFIGMARVVLGMSQGLPPSPAPRREPLSSVLPPLALGALVLWLGLAPPAALTLALHDVARQLGGP